MLTLGQAARDLAGLDAVADPTPAHVRALLAKAGKTAVIPPGRNRKSLPPLINRVKRCTNGVIPVRTSSRTSSRTFCAAPRHARCETAARNFLAGVYLAAAIIWLD
jgi:hypothetical protein